MAESIKNQKTAKLLQKALAVVFLRETASLLDNVIVTVTKVRVSPDLRLAKVYLSCLLSKDRPSLMIKIEQQKRTFRRLLGNYVGNKLNRIPELQFYADNSVEYATRVHQLLDELNLSESTASMQEKKLSQ